MIESDGLVVAELEQFNRTQDFRFLEKAAG